MVETNSVKQIPSEGISLDKRMRARQLASTVHQGRKVCFVILDDDPVTGYLAGWDDETYLVVYPDKYEGICKTMIPKHQVLRFNLFDEKTFQDEPQYQQMNALVQPFRNVINQTYFNRNR